MATEPAGQTAERLDNNKNGWALLGAFRVSLDFRKILLAVAGVLLLQAGWTGIDRAFEPLQGPLVVPGVQAELVPSPIVSSWEELADVFGQAAVLVTDPYRLPATPFLKLFPLGQGWRFFCQAGLAAFWALIVWGPIGGAIARIAVLDASGSTERIGLFTALRFAFGRIGSLLWSPLGPLIGVTFFAVLCAPIGLLYQLDQAIAEMIAGALAFLPLLAGLVMALILLGLAAGWPLMILTVAAEGEDGFDAISRSYSYASRRPARYAGSVLICWALGVVGLLFIGTFARLVFALAAWGLAFGAPDAKVLQLFSTTALETTTNPGAITHNFWLQAVGLLTYSWIYSYFWSAFAHIYLFLRKEIDGTPWYDVYLPQHDQDDFVPETPADPDPQPEQPTKEN